MNFKSMESFGKILFLTCKITWDKDQRGVSNLLKTQLFKISHFPTDYLSSSEIPPKYFVLIVLKTL